MCVLFAYMNCLWIYCLVTSGVLHVCDVLMCLQTDYENRTNREAKFQLTAFFPRMAIKYEENQFPVSSFRFEKFHLLSNVQHHNS